jgi:hypothetical protein
LNKNVIYTIGMDRALPDDVAKLAEHLDAFVLDIYFPDFRIPDWDLRFLEKLLKGRYQHMIELGEVIATEGHEPVIYDPKVGYPKAQQILDHQNIILLCRCWGHVGCHRAQVAANLCEMGGTCIIHLTGRFNCDMKVLRYNEGK